MISVVGFKIILILGHTGETPPVMSDGCAQGEEGERETAGAREIRD